MGGFGITHWLIVGVFVYVIYRIIAGRPKAPPSARSAPAPVPASTPLQATITYGDDEADAWEGTFWEVADPRDLAVSLEFDYVDGAGRKTHRTVEVRQFGDMGSTVLIIGRCLMRRATRTFRADRMTRCVDLSTGELVSDVAAYMRALYEASPARGREQLIAAEFDTLRVLLYVGKADGQLRAPEKAVIRHTAKAFAPASELGDGDIDRVLAELAAPTIGAFKLAVGRLARRDAAIKEMLLKAAEAMVATQKTVHQAEQEALDYMRKRFAE